MRDKGPHEIILKSVTIEENKCMPGNTVKKERSRI
jgi:hypothetical protein